MFNFFGRKHGILYARLYAGHPYGDREKGLVRLA